MEIHNVKQEIINECIDQNGFLVLLHSRAKFDKEKYQKLVNNISTYANLLGNNDQIDRSVAACLFELMTAITTTLDEFSEMRHPGLAIVQNAHVELSNLLHNQVFIISVRK